MAMTLITLRAIKRLNYHTFQEICHDITFDSLGDQRTLTYEGL